jgi:hypothetical protein
MTWAKFGAEFFDEVALAGLTDNAARLHFEAIMWAYRNGWGLSIPARLLGKITDCSDPRGGAAELADRDFWKRTADGWEIVHHADVVRASITSQQAKATRNRKDQQAHRARVRRLRAVPDSPESDRRRNYADTDHEKQASASGKVSAYTDRQTEQTDRAPSRSRTRKRDDRDE